MRPNERLFIGCVVTLFAVMIGWRTRECWSNEVVCDANGTGEMFYKWRVPENDGLHCGLIVARVLGYDVPYSLLSKELRDGSVDGKTNFLSLQTALRRLGVPAKVVLCPNIERLKSLLPVIVHLNDPVLEQSGFAVLYGANGDKFQFIHGGFVTFSTMRSDEFFSVCSNSIMVIGRSQQYFPLDFICPCALIALVAVVIWRNGRKVLATVVCLAVGLDFVLPATAEEFPDEAKRAIEANAKNLSPITAAWTRTRSSNLGVAELLRRAQLPERMKYILEPEYVLYKYQDGMSYFYAKYASAKLDDDDRFLSVMQVEQEIAFNSRNFYNGKPNHLGNEAAPRLIISPLALEKKKNPNVEFMRSLYFEEAGFRLPATPMEQGQGARSVPLALLSGGGILTHVIEQTLGEYKCTLIEIVGASDERRFVFYLAHEMNYAVIKREEYAPEGQLAVKSELSEFVQLGRKGANSLWLPRRCQVDHFRWGKARTRPGEKPIVSESIIVTEIESNEIPLDAFTLTYNEPGAFIADGTIEGADKTESGWISYVVPADQAELEKRIREARDGLVADRHSTVRVWLIGINVCAIVLMAGALFHRKSKTRSTP